MKDESTRLYRGMRNKQHILIVEMRHTPVLSYIQGLHTTTEFLRCDSVPDADAE
jgi:hypothetical protein